MIPIQSLGLGLYPKGILEIATEPELVPVFEIINGGRHYKIYANGRVEGLDAYGPAVVINRFSQAFIVPTPKIATIDEASA